MAVNGSSYYCGGLGEARLHGNLDNDNLLKVVRQLNDFVRCCTAGICAELAFRDKAVATVFAVTCSSSVNPLRDAKFYSTKEKASKALKAIAKDRQNKANECH